MERVWSCEIFIDGKLWKTSPNNNSEITNGMWVWLGKGFLGPQFPIYWACHHLFPVNYPLQCKVIAESSWSQWDLRQVSLLENAIFHTALEIQQHVVINDHRMIIITFYCRVEHPEMEATRRNHQNPGPAQGALTNLFPLGTSNRSWGNGMKQYQGNFRLDIRKRFFHPGGDTETGSPEKWSQHQDVYSWRIQTRSARGL